MHDKYVICDDQTLLLGGRNTFSYFIGDYDTDGRSYDREVLIYNTDSANGAEKSVISQVETYFQSIWNGDATRQFHEEENLQKKEKVQESIRKLEERYRTLKEKISAVF